VDGRLLCHITGDAYPRLSKRRQRSQPLSRFAPGVVGAPERPARRRTERSKKRIVGSCLELTPKLTPQIYFSGFLRRRNWEFSNIYLH
jgi:hypothetical protein